MSLIFLVLALYGFSVATSELSFSRRRESGKRMVLGGVHRMEMPQGRDSGCPPGNTCLYTNRCCPLPYAQSCADGVHCCPSNTSCNAVRGECEARAPSGEMVAVPWERTSVQPCAPAANSERPQQKRLGARSGKMNVNVRVNGNQVCPDSQSSCADDQTCCLLESGSYGCCPLPDAVCCSDHEHCCPSGYTCDVAELRCIRSSFSGESRRHPLVALLSRDTTEERAHVKTPAAPGKAGVDATLTQLEAFVALFARDRVRPRNLPLLPNANNECPDHKSECPQGTTCCQLTSGEYGCCPMLDAVCCSDKEHCCPENTECDLEHLRCVRKQKSESATAVMKYPLTAVASEPKRQTNGSNAVCPDGHSYCQDYQTCCLLRTGSYGCCPYSSAVCCADLASCCPYGYVCDIQTHQCLRSSDDSSKKSPPPPASISKWVAHSSAPASQEDGEKDNQLCPDHQSSCPEGTTCCQLASGAYGCCPMPNAVCCSDKEHCCPSGTTCDLVHQRCVRSTTVEVKVVPTKALKDAAPIAMDKFEAGNGSNVVCPDGHSYCQDYQTCCLLRSGSYGCCPYSSAVCCADYASCCPYGYVCNIQTHQCLRSGAPKELERKPAETSSALSVVLSSEEASSEEKSNQICPDQRSSCPEQTTCCQLSSGAYGCCPLPKAVCCSDKEHCCPEDTTCDLAHERCVHGNSLLNDLPEFVPMRRKLPARLIPRKPESPQGEIAADTPSGTGSGCPDGHSCCNGNTCCALYNAKCCADGKHCCPSNTVCNLAKGTCDTPAPGVWVPWERVFSVAACN